MTRTLLLAALTLAATLVALAPHAQAQAQKSSFALSDVSLSLQQRAADELSSIDSESTAATVMYAVGAPIGILSLASGGMGMLFLSGGSLGGLVFLAGAALGGIVSLILIGIAVGLDVDSGSRRGGLQRRLRDGFDVGLAAVQAGDTVSVGLGASF